MSPIAWLRFLAGCRRGNPLIVAMLLSWCGISVSGIHAQAAGGDPLIVIFLVRHAEPLYPPPADAPRDPPLNVMGQERADALARLLAPEEIERVYSTDYRRTRETAAPLARQLGSEVVLYDPADLEAFAARLMSTPGRSLVVGHSNTTPRLVELLGGEAGEPIDEGREFDRLYLLSGSRTEGLRTVVLRYGDPLPDSWRELADRRRTGSEDAAVVDRAIRERRYCTQFGPFLIRFDREKVAGIYAIVPNGHLGTVVGSLTGGRIVGRWHEATSAGDIEILTEDQWAGFVARYRTDEEPERWYEDWRGVEQPPGSTVQVEHAGVTLLCERPMGAP